MNPISAWLAGNRPYDAGVQLFMQHGSDGLLKKLFAEPWSEFKERKLAQVLLELQPVATSVMEFPRNLVEIPQSIKESSAELPKTIVRGWPSVMDDTIAPLHADWLKLFSEKKNLQSRIYDVAKAGQKDEAKRREAGAMAHRILDLRDACRSVYQKRDYYLQHGKLPEDPKPVELVADPKRYPVALQNHKRYVRDYKNKLLKNPDDKTAQAQLEKHLWAVAEYEKLLGL